VVFSLLRPFERFLKVLSSFGEALIPSHLPDGQVKTGAGRRFQGVDVFQCFLPPSCGLAPCLVEPVGMEVPE
jgi:hypothetical protein